MTFEVLFYIHRPPSQYINFSPYYDLTWGFRIHACWIPACEAGIHVLVNARRKHTCRHVLVKLVAAQACAADTPAFWVNRILSNEEKENKYYKHGVHWTVKMTYSEQYVGFSEHQGLKKRQISLWRDLFFSCAFLSSIINVLGYTSKSHVPWLWVAL